MIRRNVDNSKDPASRAEESSPAGAGDGPALGSASDLLTPSPTDLGLESPEIGTELVDNEMLAEGGTAPRFSAHLNTYAGPLDLLLYLVHKNEIEIFDIPIASILEQFLAHVSSLEEAGLLNLSEAGEFLVMAARLMEIKSRMLLPRPEDQEDDEALEAELEDPRVSLVEQLLAYKEIKERAVLLEEIHQQRALCFERIPPDDLPEPEAVLELGEVSLWDLTEAFHRVVEAAKNRSQVRVIEFDEVPVEDVIRSLRVRFDQAPAEVFPFRQLFPTAASLGVLIAHFLAVLEMTRLQLIQLTQDDELGEIHVCRRAPH